MHVLSIYSVLFSLLPCAVRTAQSERESLSNKCTCSGPRNTLSLEINTNNQDSFDSPANTTIIMDSAWGKAKYDYYYTNYVDKDYPNKLSAKEESAAAVEEEEGRRIQKRILSTLDDFELVAGFEDDESNDNILESLEQANLSPPTGSDKKRKRVKFEASSDEEDDGDDDEDDDDDDEEEDEDDESAEDCTNSDSNQGRQRRPINMAMHKNRGLTPYKKKEFRNPRVKHKMKYKKAMSKRRRNIREAQPEYHRYSGETTGIKTSTVKSIRLC